MFIAMNRFRVRRGAERDFEQVWLSRETHLENVPGVIVFHLLKGSERDEYVLYASHSLWPSEKHFADWTRSEAFRKAHESARRQQAALFRPSRVRGLHGFAGSEG